MSKTLLFKLLLAALFISLCLFGYRLLEKYQPIIDGEIIKVEILDIYGSHHGEGVFFLKVKNDKGIKIILIPDTYEVAVGSEIRLRKKTPKFIGKLYYEPIE